VAVAVLPCVGDKSGWSSLTARSACGYPFREEEIRNVSRIDIYMVWHGMIMWFRINAMDTFSEVFYFKSIFVGFKLSISTKYRFFNLKY
jgi:hypothetical protein